MLPFGNVAGSTAVGNTDLIQRLHTGVATLLAEITCVIVGQAKYVESRVTEMRGVARRTAKQVTQAGILTYLDRLTTVHQYSLKIAKFHIGRFQVDGCLGKLPCSVILGEAIAWEICAQHQVAYRGDGQGWLRGSADFDLRFGLGSSWRCLLGAGRDTGLYSLLGNRRRPGAGRYYAAGPQGQQSSDRLIH